MKKFLLIFAYWLPLTLSAQQHYWQQEVNNTIDVSLNDIEHTLDGFIKIQYTNHSPDTLRFIWFHLWPNAFKTDRTAFSEQMLQNGKTDFYFSDKEQKGYINRLDFRVNGEAAKMEDHPLFIDVIKLILPNILLPNQQVEITTPFHVKLPYNFSRGGHVGQSYQITQWFPKPAVYDSKGWHEMPYLQQGEFYNEFGSFDVRITVPKNYVVAATGELQNEDEKEWLLSKGQEIRTKEQVSRNKKPQTTNHKLQTTNYKQIFSDKETKTLQYKQNNIHDFAWFADKNFIVNHDTVQLISGKTIDAYSFYLPEENSPWKKSIQYIKEAIRFRSSLIAEYPFTTISAVEAKTGITGGMEYPTITSIPPSLSERKLEATIEHEIGHNWFYAVLANNEREHPWMDEGMNTFYDNKFSWQKYHAKVQLIEVKEKFVQQRMPDDVAHTALQTMVDINNDQPIETSSENFSEFNYGLIAYRKTAEWMKHLENYLGADVFANCMHEYYKRWQFKHPYPEDFKKVIEDVSGKNVDAAFALLNKKGMPEKEETKRKTKLAFVFNAKETDKYNYISLAPAIGYNMYDKFMIGAIVHNYNFPPNKFQFVIAPLYAATSKQLNGIGNISYSWYSDNKFQKIKIGLTAARFSTLSGTDSNSNNIFGGFYKIVPSIRFIFKNNNARSTFEKWIDFKAFIIGEKGFDYHLKISDSNYYPSTQKYSTRYLNQLTFNVEDYRVLYPYNAQFQVQQADQWYRLNFTTNYFFNYSKGGGMSVRLFAAKFGYFGEKTSAKNFATYSYQPKLTASIGSDDYTYSNYFIGRNEFDGFASQQIMMKDGGLKLRTDMFQNLQGRSDNWVAALNFNTTLPASIIPKQIPLKVFFDIGTYSEAWSSNPLTSKFLFVGGLQLSLIKNIINIYAPIFYSGDFRSQLKTLSSENTFAKKISFSIDLQNINLRRINRNIPF
ncbi:MAG TPA: M1 family metallopeptidase [Puia sp.]|nr:M1 family metallopeptidase [Puia sp.]